MREVKFEICKLCQRDINLSKDHYVEVIDYKNGKFFMKGYYHNKCYNDRINGSPALRTKIIEAMSIDLYKKANKLLKDSGHSQEEEYIIR
ncbi:MAG: hypothetical protein WD512_00015 [Candidatus Paceibacterota bacterium]